MKFVDFLVLPKEITPFEASYLRRLNRVGLGFFALCVPVFTGIAAANGTGALTAIALTMAVLLGPAVAFLTLKNPRSISVIYGVAAMCMGGVLVHLGQGPMQIEMHFFFFSVLAMLAVFGNPMVVLSATVTVALHHLVLWLLLPKSVFNYDAPVWVVGVHALFVVLESVAACFIARSFFDNVIGLEKVVAQRTSQLDGRNRDMRMVLDNVDQGFITLDRKGVMAAERSRIVERWFGPIAEGATLESFLRGVDPTFAASTAVGWEELTGGFMPLELNLHQMPGSLVHDGRHYRFSYEPIGEGEEPERFLLVISDETNEVERAVGERERREEMRVFEHLWSDRRRFGEFLSEATSLVDTIAQARILELVILKRALHTLKGNASFFGLDSVADLCHKMENRIVEEGEVPDATTIEVLKVRWDRIVRDVQRLGGAESNVLELSREDRSELERAIRSGGSPERLLALLKDFELEPVYGRLMHFAQHAAQIAARLDKGNVEVAVEETTLRLDADQWAPFWAALIHAVRNAIDHGLETAEERELRGKPTAAHLTFRASSQAGHLAIEVVDDGRGIDWDRVRAKAAQQGLPTGTRADLVAALFCEGLSTKETASEVSGRGVGMGALLAVTESMGGAVEVDSETDKGTTVRMVFPVSGALVVGGARRVTLTPARRSEAPAPPS
ncbi:MAG: hypothetical protein HOO96_21495 [Polyangiaceae bacterium]|nr:hypothetical protein [Polyangiaceae bacterium]